MSAPIALKTAAHVLNLTPEGLRTRLIRTGAGFRRGARWFVMPIELRRMLIASRVLRRKETVGAEGNAQ
jgi:hypothetical protein